MVAHAIPRRFIKRQRTTDPLPVPTGAGITNAITVGSGTSTQTDLVFDTTATDTGMGTETVPPFAITSTPVITITPSAQEPTTPTSHPSLSPSAASNASTPIPVITVVGSCVGAFIGTVALICLGLWFYRRYYRSLKKRAHSRRPPGKSRNARGNVARRQSHLEPWNKLVGGDDKWEGMYQTKEIDNVAPMEKLAMFKKTPSVRTAWTQKSEEHPVVFDPQSFAQYHSSIAKGFESDKVFERSDAPILSLNHVSGSMSPSLDMAIPTPPAVSSQLHRWESVEVIHYDAEKSMKTDDKNPDPERGIERRKSFSNPFFNAQRPSTSPSRSSSKSTVVPTPKLNKGKGRAVELENPFDNERPPSFSPPTKHTNWGSQSSVGSQDRALKSLIAALEVPGTEAKGLLREPSVRSSISAYTNAEEGLDFTGLFPLPPSSDQGSHKLR